MKDNNVLLNIEQRKLFKQLLKLTKFKKHILASYIDMQASSFSEATSIRNDGTLSYRTFSTKQWHDLLAILDTDLTANDSNRIEKKQLREASRILDKLKDRVEQVIEHEGVPLTEKAPNYVKRDADSLLKQRFDNKIAYFWINGGAKKGKSSLLNQAKKECEERGIIFHLCDFRKLIDAKALQETDLPAPLLSYREVFQFILKHTTASNNQLTYDCFNELIQEFKTAFIRWKNAETMPDKEYFIAIDHLDSLIDPLLIHDNRIQEGAFNPFMVIQFILQTCLSLSRELQNISFALVVEDYLYISAKISPLISQAARIELKALTNEEIVQLWQIIKPQDSTIEIGLTQAEIIHEKVGGNPFLIQCLLQDICQNTLPNQPLFDYIKQLLQKIKNSEDLINKEDKAYLCYQAKVITMLQKIAAQSEFSDDVETLTFDEIVEKLMQLESTVLDPVIYRSFERIGFIDESNNQLKPLIKLILDTERSSGDI